MEITQERFSKIIEKYILPLMPIAQEGQTYDLASISFRNKLSGERVQTIQENGTNYIIFCPKQEKQDFYYIAELSCVTNHLKTVRIVLDSLLSAVSRLNISDMKRAGFYMDAICHASVTLGICILLTATAEEAFLLADVIKAFETWAQRTYEGRKVPFGIIVDFDDKNNVNEGQDYISFLDSKYSASFTDGVFSAILLNANGKIVEHIALPYKEKKYDSNHKGKFYSLTPTRFANFSRLCNAQKVGIIALSNGDILTIKNTEMMYAKREGHWLAYSYSAFFRPCIDNVLLFASKGKNKSNKTTTENIAKTVYQSILDASFSHSGACISIADFRQYGDDLKDTLHNCLISEDIDSSPEFIEKIGRSKYFSMCTKQAIIRQLTHYRIENIKKPTTSSFGSLSNKLRVELLSMDGAVVLDKGGRIRAVGAILQISPGSAEGGRFAAARELSKYGVAFKVSEDGGITGLYKEQSIFKIG